MIAKPFSAMKLFLAFLMPTLVFLGSLSALSSTDDQTSHEPGKSYFSCGKCSHKIVRIPNTFRTSHHFKSQDGRSICMFDDAGDDHLRLIDKNPSDHDSKTDPSEQIQYDSKGQPYNESGCSSGGIFHFYSAQEKLAVLNQLIANHYSCNNLITLEKITRYHARSQGDPRSYNMVRKYELKCEKPLQCENATPIGD